MYLVATDLNGEGQHLLVWTIGIVLGGGDRLIAISAIDQDTIGDGGKIVLDDRIRGALSSWAAAMGTSLASMKMPHTPRVLGSRGRSVLEAWVSRITL